MGEDEVWSGRRGSELLAKIFEGDLDGSSARLPLRGQCMDPLLVDGDRVEVTTLPDRPRIGQLVVAITPHGELVCHRLIGRDRAGRLLLAGDWGGRVDVVEQDAAVGTAVAVERGGRLCPLDGGWLLRLTDALIAHLRRWAWRLAPVSPRLLRAPRRPIEWVRRLLILLRSRTVS